ncbi:hypothetical protein [Angustibacter sp. Root456]|uniref:hypothetical protein n=1 Tax=Angustibacter sp. Root456 TaxID=1736539 RepID=UPI0007004CA2|nr:hypothetical protein [Angustibacter sp. Root456]KQX66766.1 hypothetical protein ASD06_05410 [Angustibacter sp. Root456]
MPKPFVPPELADRAFTAEQAAGLGVSARMLRGAQWRQLLRGVYCHRDLTIDDDVRLAAARLALPEDAVASGRLAAWLHGAWSPSPGEPLPLEWARDKARARPLRTLDGSHRLVVEGSDVVVVRGLRCTSAMRTAFQLMRRAPLVEAVVVAEAFAWCGQLELPWLWAYVDAHRRWPGVEHTRRALDFVKNGVRSPGESRLRMVAVLGGLPEPLVNLPVERGRELLGVLDLYLIGRRPAGAEYDGAYHESAAQRTADNRRENRITVETGLPVLRYDRRSISRHAARERVLWEMARATGVEPRNSLDPRWFNDPRRPFRW